MSHHQYKRLRSSLTPFIRFALVIACLGLLASCGGGSTSTFSGGTTEINTSGDIPFSVNNLDISSREAIQSGKTLDDVSATILNQFWIMPPKSDDKDNTLKIISSHAKLKVIAYREVMGYLIEIVENDSDAKSQLEKLKTELPMHSIFNNEYVGKKYDRTYVFSLPNDGSKFDDQGDNWHIEYAKIDKAWEITTGADNHLIGVLDEGFYAGHEELIGRIHANYSSNTSKHGTGVATTIGANTDNGLGISGINWTTKMVLSNYVDGMPDRTVQNYQEMINKNPTIQVINNSWGDYFCDKQLVIKDRLSCPSERGLIATRKYRKLAINNPNIIHVWASGNDGNAAATQNGSLHIDDSGQPSRLSNVIVVGALLKNGTLAHYSDYGDFIDIAAPTEIKAASYSNSGGSYYHRTTSDLYGTNYSGGFNGTSAASPVIAGVISLMLSVNNRLSAEEIKSILITTADRAADKVTRTDGTTISLARSIPIVNAEKAVRAALSTLPLPTANIIIVTPSPVAGSGVIFQPNTTSPNGAVTEYEWDFGDGTILMGNASQISHIYASGGTYTVKLKIKDAKGVMNTASTTITVAAAIPTPSIARINPTTVTAGISQDFSIFGTNLPLTPLDITFNGCANIVYAATRTANLHQFTCTPQVAGAMTAVVRTVTNTAPIYSVDVTVVSAPTANTNLLLGATNTDTCTNTVWCTPQNAQSVTDGDITTARNLTRFSGTFNMVLSNPASIGSIRILPSMSPSGNVNFEIRTSTDPAGAAGTWTSHGGVLNRVWNDNTWVNIILNSNTTNVRMVQVIVNSSPSWVALYEVQGFAPVP